MTLSDGACYLVSLLAPLLSPSHALRCAVQAGPILGFGRRFGGPKHDMFALPAISRKSYSISSHPCNPYFNVGRLKIRRDILTDMGAYLTTQKAPK